MHDVPLVTAGRAHTYHIFVGNGLMHQISNLLEVDRYSTLFIITDEVVERLWLPKLQQQLPKPSTSIALPAGEQSKNIDNVERIWSSMSKAGCDRKSLVLILGGGVIGDIGAFAASTYMRGVPFVHIPTTLLAQVDSSIGGKTGFDFDDLKNLIGTFAQPEAVVVDTDTLSTLPKREFTAGFAEMLKHGLVYDASYFEKLAQKPPTEYDIRELTDLITRSIHIKTDIVQSDEKESGERKLINFGHTVGHAVEALSWESSHPLLHGEAVAIGMVVETALSCRKGLLKRSDEQRIIEAIQSAGLPIQVPHVSLKDLREKMNSDKKNEQGIILLTLLEDIGKATYNQTVAEPLLVETIKNHMEP